MLVLGIDPGLRCTGFGLIEYHKNAAIYIASGIISTCAQEEMHKRLLVIFEGIRTVINTYNPQVVCIEKIFLNINPKTTLILGQARGVAICAATININTLYEYTALQIKQSIVGYGHADKKQIQEMIKQRLKLNTTPKADAADALACALTHIQYSSNMYIK